MEPTPGNLRLLAAIDKTSRDMGIGPVTMDDPATRGAGETINLKQFPLLIMRAAILMSRLSHEQR